MMAAAQKAGSGRHARKRRSRQAGKGTQEADGRRGAGHRRRTDRCRVHARGQCANVQLSVALPVRQLEDELNRLLPDDIGVSRMRIAGERFPQPFLRDREILSLPHPHRQ